MARKNLSPGVNALRLAERVSAVPPDEIKDVSEKEPGPPPARKEETRGEIAFSPAELELIKKSCLEYKNSLPSYLRSVQRDLRLLESIIKKCARDGD
jgi:hypothetical protein